MTAATTRRAASPAQGLGLALLTAATFATSGTFATSLLDAGWSPAAAVTVRLLDRRGRPDPPGRLGDARAVGASGRHVAHDAELRRDRGRGLAAVLLQRRRAPVGRDRAAARVPRDRPDRGLAVAAPRAAAPATHPGGHRGRHRRPGARAEPQRSAAPQPDRRAVGLRCGRRASRRSSSSPPTARTACRRSRWPGVAWRSAPAACCCSVWSMPSPMYWSTSGRPVPAPPGQLAGARPRAGAGRRGRPVRQRHSRRPDPRARSSPRSSA